MEQYADEFERQCAALRSRLATEENKSRRLESERDALREQCEKLESVRKAAKAYRESEGGKSFTHWSQRVSNTRELDAALAATEVK